MDFYLTVKWVHIVSSTVLFGTGFGTVLHMLLAHRSRNVQAIAVVTRSIIKTGWLCILPAGFVQPVSGMILIYKGGFSPGALWLQVTSGLYLLAGLCWVLTVILQSEIGTLASAAANAGQPLPKRYQTLFRWWLALNGPAFIALIAIYALMVMKPE